MTVASEQEAQETFSAAKPGSAADPLAAEERPNNRQLLNGLIKALAVGVVLVGLIAAVWRWWDQLLPQVAFLADQEAFAAYLQSFGALGPAVLAFFQLLQVLIAVIPGHIFLIAGGYVYGFPLGLLMNIGFTVLASQLCFLMAAFAGRPLVHRLMKREQVDYWERIANEKGVLFFTVAFVLPVFPSDVMNFVAGLSGISGRKFLIANFFGRLPSAIMLTLIGSHGLTFSNFVWGVIAVALATLLIGGQIVFTRIKRSADVVA